MSSLSAATLAVAVTSTSVVAVNLVSRATLGANLVTFGITHQPDVTYTLVSTALGAWIIWGIAKCRDDLMQHTTRLKLEDMWRKTGLAPYESPASRDEAAPTSRPALLYIVGGTEAAQTGPVHTPGGCDQHSA